MAYVDNKEAFPWTSAAAFTFWDVPEVYRTCPWSELQPLYDFQDGRCAMCGMGRTNLVEDHDHTTGLVRGLLCRSCNASEPHNEHEAWRLWRAGVTPMNKLGLEAEYFSPFGPAITKPVESEADQARLWRAVREMGSEAS